MNNALSIIGSGYSLDITPSAQQLKAEALASARAITEVTDADGCTLAQAKIKTLAGLRTGVEASRKEVKKPVIDLGKRIDAMASEFVQDIDSEEHRLSGLVADYVREQQRIQREAVEAARRESERIERERQEAERKAREAEMAALRAQQDASDKSRREAEAAQRQAEAAKREAEEARRRAEEAAKAAQVPAPIQPAQKGVSEVVDFEVVDIDAFHAKFPQLCTVTVNRAEVLTALAKSFAKNKRLPEVAGLRVFHSMRVGRRTV